MTKILRYFIKYLQKQLKNLIERSQEKYYLHIAKKLMDLMTSLKTYWSILKILLNNKKNPCIPPLLQDNKYVTDFKKKAELFNCFFGKQCSCDDIATLIKNLDPNKAHGHDMIRIRMLKLCSKSICKPLDLIFQSCIKWKISY